MTTAVKSELAGDGLVEKSYVLEGLGCANCAAKMEAEIKRLDGVIDANVNFMNKKLNIEIDSNSDIKGIINKAEKIVKSIESHVDIVPIGENSSGHSHGNDHSSHNQGHSHGHNHGDDSISSEFKKELFKILIGVCIEP